MAATAVTIKISWTIPSHLTSKQLLLAAVTARWMTTVRCNLHNAHSNNSALLSNSSKKVERHRQASGLRGENLMKLKHLRCAMILLTPAHRHGSVSCLGDSG